MASRKTSPRKTAVFRLEGAEENGTKDLGLVKLGRECVGWEKRSVPWGWVTDAGRAFLARLDATR